MSAKIKQGYAKQQVLERSVDEPKSSKISSKLN